MNALRIAENVALLRKKIGITQDELAGFLGVTKASVSKWENGVSKDKETTYKLTLTLLPIHKFTEQLEVLLWHRT